MFNKMSAGVMFVLALAGGMFFSAGPQIPPAKPPNIPDSKSRGASKSINPALQNRFDGPCPVIRNFLNRADSPESEESSGSLVLTSKPNGEIAYRRNPPSAPVDPSCGEGELSYLIALVSDPVNSHLSLAFDRTLESVQSAASAAGYQFVSYYFPWKPELVREELDLEKRSAQLKEKQRLEKYPGVLLFRSKCGQDHTKTKEQCNADPADRALAIFLVSETPTFGVNHVAFLRALSYMGECNPCHWTQVVPLVGPNYSGSVPSLRQAMESRNTGAFHVFNGAATDKEKIASLAAPSVETPAVVWSLSNFIHSDQAALVAVLDADFAQSKVAILAEDETAYGNGALCYDLPEDKCELVRTIHFPRDISHFRNAIHPLPDPGSNRGEGTSLIRQSLPFDLRESEGRDSIPSLSGQSASAQQAVLTNITRELNEGRYSYVGIRASDPLDVIFLSRLVREEVPDARLFIFDADLLFVRAAADSPLTGMLSVTTYPLLMRNQAWSAGSNTAVQNQFNSFPNRAAEATYNATLAAIASFMGNAEANKLVKNRVSEYNWPVRDKNEATPPLWVTVLGRSGYWPVALLPSEGLQSFEETSSQGFGFLWPDRLWEVVFVGATLLALIYSWCIFRVHFSDPEQVPRWLEGMWVNSLDPGRAGRGAYLTVRTLSILTLYIFVASPLFEVVRVLERREARFFAGLAVPSLVVVALLFSAIVPLYRIARGPLRPFSTIARKQLMVMGIVSAIVAVAICLWWHALSQTREGYRGFFFAWRAINLSSGVSPLFSVLFAAAGIVWWAWANLSRLILCNDRVPCLPSIDCDPSAPLDFFFTDLTKPIEQAASLPFLEWQWRSVSAALLFGAILWDPFAIFHTVEQSSAAIVMRGEIGFLVCVTFLSFTRMAVIWFRLKYFLMHLERHPLRDAFTDLPKERMWSPIMQHGGLQRTYLLEFRALECAKKLNSLRVCGFPTLHTELLEKNLSKRLESIASGYRSSRADTVDCYDQIEAVGEKVLSMVLRREWNQGSSDTLAEIRDKVPPSQNLPTKQQLSKAAAELVVLPYLFFIRMFLMQLRNLMVSVIAGYVLLVLSISCYPYQSERTLSWGMTLSLVVFGSVMVIILAQMAQNAILSRITETNPGKLDPDFFVKLLLAGALPVFSLVASQFPAVSHFLFSWLQPTLQAIK
jgi:hypothetical protein